MSPLSVTSHVASGRTDDRNRRSALPARRASRRGLGSRVGARLAYGLLARIALGVGAAILPGIAVAAPGAFTDPSAFAAALGGGAVVIDFESLADGADVSGTTQPLPGVGVTLPGPVVDALDPSGPLLPLRIVADTGDNPASSGSRSLGVEDPKNFHAITAGTSLGFTFPHPVEGFGLTVITPEEPGLALFDDDLELRVSGEATAALSLSAGQVLGPFGGRVYRAYFLGVVGAAPFSTATLDVGPSVPTSGFLFNIDDLRVPVPEPVGAAPLFAGAALLCALRRRGLRSESLRGSTRSALMLPGSVSLRSLRSLGLALAVLGSVLASTGPALAQRPSLIDLQAAVDGLVSPAPTPASARILFQNVGGAGKLEFDLVDLTISAQWDSNSCSSVFPTSCPVTTFDPVEITVLQSADLAALSARLDGTPQTVQAFVPGNPAGDRDGRPLVDFGGAELVSIENGPVAGRMRLRLLPTTIQLRGFDTGNPGWNLATNSALNADCSTLPNGEVHVDRNGNDPTSLAPGEIEASYAFSFGVNAAPSSSFERRPTNGCALIAVGLRKFFDVSFEQLWTQDDQFGGRQAVETIDLEKVWLESWTLRFENGDFTEQLGLVYRLDGSSGSTGTRTLRDFDPATGSETNSGVFNF